MTVIARLPAGDPPDDDFGPLDYPDMPTDTSAASEPLTQTGRAAASIASVLDAWAAEGPLTHEPTGYARLDELTDGGPCYGTRWYISGAPDAAKTLLLVSVAHTYAQRGIAVGLLAVDEEPGDLVTRLAQRVGYSRRHCEIRDPGVLHGMRDALAGLPVRLYDSEHTIESAAADLAAYARAHTGGRAMLGVDSIQSVSCDLETVAERELTEVAAVTARVRAVRAVATEHRLIAIATSEQSRGAYATRDPGQRTSAMAAGKWSGAIEYSARVLCALRSVAGESDLIELEIGKNKHGPQTRDDAEPGHIYLRLDRRGQSLSEVDYAPADQSEVTADRERDRVARDAETVLGLIVAEPGITTRGVYAAAKAATGIGRTRVDAAVRYLGGRIERRPGERASQVWHAAEGAPC